jgi:cell division transport system permease protein
MSSQSKIRLGTAYITTIISISLVLFLLGVFSFIILNANKISENIKENIQFTVQLNDELKEIEQKQYQKHLDTKDFVNKTVFVSKDDAAKEFSKEIGEDFTEFLEYNPLPSIVEVYLNSDYIHPDSLTWIEKELKSSKSVTKVHYEKNFIDIIHKNVKKISLYILLFCILLGLISVVLINNTIRLLVYSKRFILKTMSLIGATNAFIKRPFMISSIFYGLNAGLIANIFLFQIIFYLQNEINGIIQIAEFDILIPLFVGILILGVLISMICTKFALDKYINLSKDKLYY